MAAPPALADAQIRSFKAQSISLVEGQGTTLVWEVTGVKTVQIEPGIGSVKSKGSVAIQPARTTTYRLFVEGLSSPGEIKVTVTASGLGPTEQGMSLGRLHGRVLLLPGEKPRDGLGLYSYVLLGDKPTPQTKGIYLQVLQAIAKLPDLSDHKEMNPKRLNGIHIPLTRKPESLEAAELLDCYDFPRAKAILMALGQEYHRPGPYLISSFLKIDVHKEQEKPYLVEDLTGAPPNVVDPWVGHFLAQAVQETPWNSQLLEKLAAGLRIQLAKAVYQVAAITLVR